MNIQNSINNENNPKRDLGDIDCVVLHHTGTNNSSKDYLNKDDYISCHYLVAKDGTIYQLMDLNRIAYHAGVSSRTRLKTKNNSLNWCSLGIEVESDGYDFTDKQKSSTKWLIENLMGMFNIPDYLVLTHKLISPARKWDIGSAFYNPMSWKDYQESLSTNYYLTLQNMLNLPQEAMDSIVQDYQPMTVEEMSEKAKEWNCLEDFRKGLKILKKPQNYKDFRNCIAFGRMKVII